MTSQPEIDRRLLLGAAGALGLVGTSALAQETKQAAKPAEAAKKLSDTIADFVVGFDVGRCRRSASSGRASLSSTPWQ